MIIRPIPTNYQKQYDAEQSGMGSFAVSGGRGGLGSITKSQSKNYSQKDTDSKRVARKQVFTLKNQSAKLMTSHRVCGCCNFRVDKNDLVGIKVSTNQNSGTATRKATLTNVFRCDSIWVCPVCAQRILAQRGKEIEQAIQINEKNGFSVFMLTLTHSHSRDDELKPKLKLIGKALTRFFGDRTMQAVFEKCGLIGHIKALEFTHSFENGWHPHNHILMFSRFAPDDFKNMQIAVTYDKDGFIRLVTAKRYKMMKQRNQLSSISHVTIEQFIKHYWRKCCLSVGLGEPSYERGATLQDADKAKSYLTKFKTAQEMTSTSKQAKGSSRNQWQLLQDSMNGDAQASALFIEYAEATKGQRQLVWSRGLKEFFKIEQVEDSQCEVPDDDDMIVVDETVVYLENEQWYFVRKNNLIPELLDIAELFGVDKLKEYIDKIPVTARPVIDDPSLAVMRL